MTAKLHGVLPPMTTPFNVDGDIEIQAVRQQVRFLIAQGAHGLVPGGSTGEGHTLETDELRRIVATVTEEAAGRVPVIAGVIVDSTRQAINKVRAIRDLGVAALQVTPVHYLFRPDDDHMLQHFRAIADEAAIPIIIYNVIPWSYLSPELLVRIMREVPGVIGVKQSAGDLKLLADLMIMAPKDKLIFGAIDALLYPSFALGAHGAISALLAAVPGTIVELWNAVASGNHPRARAIHEGLLPLWNAVSAPNMCSCIKYAQELQGCPSFLPRAPMPAASAEQREAVRAALRGLGLTIAKAA
jgi:4-hydroxy-tetrahydrodipicolinate synthase